MSDTFELLVTYDVATESPGGRRRLRRVAKACEGYGQRVQKSVFECVISSANYERLKAMLSDIIDHDQDTLRYYRLLEPRARYVETMGRRLDYDQREPLIL